MPALLQSREQQPGRALSLLVPGQGAELAAGALARVKAGVVCCPGGRPLIGHSSGGCCRTRGLRLYRERLPYAGGVPARGSLPYAASAWRGGQPALGVA